MTTEQLHQLFLKATGISTDTRKIKEGSIFFALKGDNFNGNTFAIEALNKGAKYAVVDDAAVAEKDSRLILVNNSLKALQELATHHRKFLNIAVIALTGSNGKTTTKELIYAVLSTKYNAVATQGNLNNHIGVPLTLLSFTKQTEIGIVEMGANHQKEISALCEIALPDYGVITNFGKAHLEGFGGVEGVIKGKSELYDHLIERNKTIFYNANDTVQKEKLNRYSNTISFGDTTEANTCIYLENTSPFVSVKVNNTTINSNLIGAYNFTNIAIAIAIGLYFKVPSSDIKKGIENYVPTNNRSQILNTNNNKIILDAYNANPSSMEAALKNFELLPEQNKIAILGDMFELGNDAPKEHQYIADLALNLKQIEPILVGENFYLTQTQCTKFKTYLELESFIKNNPLKNKTILIKGSRGMALERLLNWL